MATIAASSSMECYLQLRLVAVDVVKCEILKVVCSGQTMERAEPFTTVLC